MITDDTFLPPNDSGASAMSTNSSLFSQELYSLIIPALGRLRQEDLEFKRLCLKKGMEGCID